MPKQEPKIITLKKRTICSGCGMTIEKGAEMFKSLKTPNKFVCSTAP